MNFVEKITLNRLEWIFPAAKHLLGWIRPFRARPRVGTLPAASINSTSQTPLTAINSRRSRFLKKELCWENHAQSTGMNISSRKTFIGLNSTVFPRHALPVPATQLILNQLNTEITQRSPPAINPSATAQKEKDTHTHTHTHGEMGTRIFPNKRKMS